MRCLRLAMFIVVVCASVLLIAHSSDSQQELQRRLVTSGFDKVSKLSGDEAETQIRELRMENQRLIEQLREMTSETAERQEKLEEEVKKGERENLVVKKEADNVKSQLREVTLAKDALAQQVNAAQTRIESFTKRVSELDSQPFPKRRVTCKAPAVTQRPIFLFVVGAEGTGHHLIANLVDRLPGVVTLSRQIQRLFAEMWEPVINEERRFVKRELLLAHLKGAAKNATNAEGELVKGATHYVIQDKSFDMYSFPYDDPRNPLRRPDLLDLISLVEPHFDLRILVTVRTPMDSIVSLVRRKWWNLEMCKKVPIPNRVVPLFTDEPDQLGDCGFIPMQARVVEDAITYISSHLQIISQEYFRTVHYEDLLENPTSYAQPLGDFLGFPTQEVEKIIATHIKKRETDYTKVLTPRQREAIETIFDPNREQQWAFLMREDFNLQALATEGSWKKEEICVS